MVNRGLFIYDFYDVMITPGYKSDLTKGLNNPGLDWWHLGCLRKPLESSRDATLMVCENYEDLTILRFIWWYPWTTQILTRMF